MSAIQAFFAGMFLVNGMPHFIKGITGQTHMTPFKRVSNSYLNVIWAFGNFVLGLLILGTSSDTGLVNLPSGTNLWIFILGGFIMAIMCAWLFSNPNARFPWHRD